MPLDNTCLPLPTSNSRFITDARQVVANPEQYADRPLLRRMAWMALMSARGKSVDQNMLASMPVEVGQ